MTDLVGFSDGFQIQWNVAIIRGILPNSFSNFCQRFNSGYDQKFTKNAKLEQLKRFSHTILCHD